MTETAKRTDADQMSRDCLAMESREQEFKDNLDVILSPWTMPVTIADLIKILRFVWGVAYMHGVRGLEAFQVRQSLEQRRAAVEKREQTLGHEPKPAPTEAEMRRAARPCADCLHCSAPGDPAATCGHPRCLQIDNVTGAASNPRCVELRQIRDYCGIRGHYFVPRATPDAPWPTAPPDFGTIRPTHVTTLAGWVESPPGQQNGSAADRPTPTIDEFGHARNLK